MELVRDNWTKNDYDDFVEKLRSYADEKYRSFHSSLIPDNDKGFFIGVRMPVMRKLGKEISKGNGRSFLEQTTDNSYEEKTIRGIVIGLLKTESYGEFLMYSDDFVQRIDSWAVCDGFCANLKQTKKYKSEFFPHVCEYTKSDNAKNPHYYVSMARAWLVATALAKCREQTMRYIKSNSLDNATFNKMIRKCVESFRIDDETKKYLKTLKRY